MFSLLSKTAIVILATYNLTFASAFKSDRSKICSFVEGCHHFKSYSQEFSKFDSKLHNLRLAKPFGLANRKLCNLLSNLGNSYFCHLKVELIKKNLGMKLITAYTDNAWLDERMSF